ncbi:MAG: hypothetical protein H6686_10375 [Fibrobacteria bacterium]|nr:hypothetical protein [Fibrobacteria bacterium]
MKRFASRIASLLVIAASVGAQSTVYGPSGLNFVPSAFGGEGGEWSGSVGGSTDDSPLPFLTAQTRILEDQVEISLSNTWRLVEGDSVGWNPGSLPVPLVPSVKWVIDRQADGRMAWGYSAGVSMPLGAWVAAGWSIRLPLATPQVHAGLGTPLNSIGAFGGLAFDLCDLEGVPLPVRVVVDGGLSGSTGTLGRSEEGFWSAGVSTTLGRNLSFQAVHRRDRSYAVTARNRSGGISLLRILWNFGGAQGGVAR